MDVPGHPAVIIAGSFALTYAIWLILPDDGEPLYSGASQAVVWYFLALGIQSLTMTFPATVYKRWRATGMLIAWTGIALLVIGLLALTAWQGWWPQVGAWFGAQTPLSVSGWTALFCAVLSVGSYLTLRRATP